MNDYARLWFDVAESMYRLGFGLRCVSNREWTVNQLARILVVQARGEG